MGSGNPISVKQAISSVLSNFYLVPIIIAAIIGIIISRKSYKKEKKISKVILIMLGSLVIGWLVPASVDWLWSSVTVTYGSSSAM